MDNDKKPIWMNISNFIELLNSQQTQAEIAKKISDRFVQKLPGHAIDLTECENLSKKHFPLFLNELRIFQITDKKYWFVSFTGVLLFLFTEIMIFLKYNLAFNNLIQYILVSLLAFLIFYFIFMLAYSTFELENKIKWNFVKSQFYTIPAMMASVGLIILHSVLIFYSGLASSPFLPAFFFINLTIITAPRENSVKIYILTMLAAVIISMPYLGGFNIPIISSLVNFNIPISPEDKKKFPELSTLINCITLFYTIAITLTSRFWSSSKIIKNLKNEK